MGKVVGCRAACSAVGRLVKLSGWIKGAAKAAGIPVYSIKAASLNNLVRAVRTLLGIDPSPGALFTDGEAPAAADPRSRASNSRNLRAETSIALAEMAGSSSGGGSKAANQRDALEEARLAVEQIVIPQSQPVELLPRDADTIELQVQLVQSCGLPFEVVGSPTSLRLRVLPPAWAATSDTTAAAGSVAAPGRAAEAAAPAVEGAKQKEYW
ncbi:hypothetical protein COHA_002819 [Chlorella ohadii]|uniref:Uncharacterized protein n=1 Tax=Chlorella ohadii TaxID=2649997 RepID=A0AAD5H8F9_9CHLO|nr:hypothetical protein COHA_002819 [Chlorella ohadii]